MLFVLQKQLYCTEQYKYLLSPDEMKTKCSNRCPSTKFHPAHEKQMKLDRLHLESLGCNNPLTANNGGIGATTEWRTDEARHGMAVEAPSSETILILQWIFNLCVFARRSGPSDIHSTCTYTRTFHYITLQSTWLLTMVASCSVPASVMLLINIFASIAYEWMCMSASSSLPLSRAGKLN